MECAYIFHKHQGGEHGIRILEKMLHCGDCDQIFAKLQELHDHMIDHGGVGYFYTYSSKTAYTKSTYKCQETQTDEVNRVHENVKLPREANIHNLVIAHGKTVKPSSRPCEGKVHFLTEILQTERSAVHIHEDVIVPRESELRKLVNDHTNTATSTNGLFKEKAHFMNEMLEDLRRFRHLFKSQVGGKILSDKQTVYEGSSKEPDDNTVHGENIAQAGTEGEVTEQSLTASNIHWKRTKYDQYLRSVKESKTTSNNETNTGSNIPTPFIEGYGNSVPIVNDTSSLGDSHMGGFIEFLRRTNVELSLDSSERITCSHLSKDSSHLKTNTANTSTDNQCSNNKDADPHVFENRIFQNKQPQLQTVPNKEYGDCVNMRPEFMQVTSTKLGKENVGHLCDMNAPEIEEDNLSFKQHSNHEKFTAVKSGEKQLKTTHEKSYISHTETEVSLEREIEVSFERDSLNETEVREDTAVSHNSPVVNVDSNFTFSQTRGDGAHQNHKDLNASSVLPQNKINTNLIRNKHNQANKSRTEEKKFSHTSNSYCSSQRKKIHKQVFKCDPCSAAFHNKQSLAKHRASNHEGNQYKCDLCGIILHSVSSWKHHKATIHFISVGKEHRCDQCNKLFVYQRQLQQHYNEVHEQSQLYVCSICNYETYERAKFLDHRGKAHSDKCYSCPHCSYKTSRKYSLKQHSNTHTHKNTVKTKICHICGKHCRGSSVLTRHLRIHNGETPFQCTECPKRFKTDMSFKRHMDMHADKREYTCTYCQKQFVQKSNCISHMRQHTGEKPYKCSLCEDSFTHKVSCKNHLWKKHGVTST